MGEGSARRGRKMRRRVASSGHGFSTRSGFLSPGLLPISLFNASTLQLRSNFPLVMVVAYFLKDFPRCFPGFSSVLGGTRTFVPLRSAAYAGRRPVCHEVCRRKIKKEEIMNCKHPWGRPALLVALLLCGASLGVHRTQAAPSANLDQTRNGKFDAPTGGITVGTDDNGNAGFQNSHYLEGHGIPYRCVMSDLPPNTTITIRLGFDIRHSSRNAIDYLTGFQLLDPHTQFGHPPEEVNPTVGTTLFMEPPPLPDSELLIATPNATIPANSFNNLPTQTLRDASKRKMSLWGGTLNTITYVDDSASWNAKLGQDISQIQIDVTFTTGSGTVAILSWAGHIASRTDWGFDANGIPNSAGGISGSPYHLALVSGTLSNIGQQDRSLKANAV